MTEVQLIIHAEPVWLKGNGDCSSCYACDDLIFGDKYTLYLSIAVGKIGKSQTSINKTGISICKSCYELQNDE